METDETEDELYEWDESVEFPIFYHAEFHRAGMLAMLVLHASAADEEADKSDMQEMLDTMKSIKDKMEAATDSFTLNFDELFLFYTSANMMSRVHHLPVVEDFITNMSGKNDPDFVKEVQDYYGTISRGVLSSCNEAFYDIREFQHLKNTIEIMFDRQN